MRHTILLVAALLAVAIAARPGRAQQMPEAPPVDVATPLVETIVDYDEFTGRFTAVKEVDIRSRVSGYLEEIHFRDGQLVEEGEPLFTIDRRTFEAAVDRARAQLASARASRDLAGIELERASQLARRNVGTAQEVDRTQAALAEAEAAVQVAEAELREAELNLDFTTIDAPIAGRMSEAMIDEGNLIIGGAGNATLLSTVVSVDPIHFTFSASEADFLKYSRLAQIGTRPSSRVTDTPVSVRLMDERGYVHEGHMDFVDNVIDPNSGTIVGRAVLPNDDGLLIPGLFGRLRLPGSGPYEALLVPDEAVLADQSEFIVMVVGEDGTVAQRRVAPGPLHKGMRVIRDGLSRDDRIVVADVQRARPGQKVTPEPVELALREE